MGDLGATHFYGTSIAFSHFSHRINHIRESGW